MLRFALLVPITVVGLPAPGHALRRAGRGPGRREREARRPSGEVARLRACSSRLRARRCGSTTSATGRSTTTRARTPTSPGSFPERRLHLPADPARPAAVLPDRGHVLALRRLRLHRPAGARADGHLDGRDALLPAPPARPRRRLHGRRAARDRPDLPVLLALRPRGHLLRGDQPRAARGGVPLPRRAAALASGADRRADRARLRDQGDDVHRRLRGLHVLRDPAACARAAAGRPRGAVRSVGWEAWGGRSRRSRRLHAAVHGLPDQPPGLWDGLYEGIAYWLGQHGVGRGGEKPYFYVVVLFGEEWPVLLLGAVGAFVAFRQPTVLRAFLVWAFVLSLAIYSWAGEKFAWLVLHPLLPLILLAGVGVQALWEARGTRLGRAGWRRRRRRALRAGRVVVGQRRAPRRPARAARLDAVLRGGQARGRRGRRRWRRRAEAVGDDRLLRRRDVPLRLVLPDLDVGYLDLPTAPPPPSDVLVMTEASAAARRRSSPATRARRFPFRVWWVRDYAKATPAPGCARSSSARPGTPPAACPSTSTCARRHQRQRRATGLARHGRDAPPGLNRVLRRAHERPERPPSPVTTTTSPHSRGGPRRRSTTQDRGGRAAGRPSSRRSGAGRGRPPVSAPTVRSSEPVSATT